MHPRVPRRAGLVLVALLASAATSGCAHADSVADRQLTEMQGTIAKIQADQDRSNDRIGDLEVGASESSVRAESSKGTGAKPAPAAAPPRTVQIGDSEDRASDDPNDPNARPEIKVQGQGGSAPSRSVRSKSSSGRRGEARIEPSDESVRPDGARSSALDPDAKKAYDAAIGLVNGRQYDRAQEALSAFLLRWPDHPYAENALYWRGESYYARGEYLRAAEQFESVLTRAGSGNKAPDALLKIGMCHDRLGATERAKEYWERLRRDYPRSDAAKRIPAVESTRGTGLGPKESR